MSVGCGDALELTKGLTVHITLESVMIEPVRPLHVCA
jgi:hypothetical protein